MDNNGEMSRAALLAQMGRSDHQRPLFAVGLHFRCAAGTAYVCVPV